MIRDIVRDTFFLAQPSALAERRDVAIATDLIDTLKANADRCVGLAANMIGERQAVRYQWIEVEYRDLKFKKQKQVFRDFPAEIVQHELDHCAGILI